MQTSPTPVLLPMTVMNALVVIYATADCLALVSPSHALIPNIPVVLLQVFPSLPWTHPSHPIIVYLFEGNTACFCRNICGLYVSIICRN